MLHSPDVSILYYYKVQPPYRGLLSSSCGGLTGPKLILADGRTNGRVGLRELDNFVWLVTGRDRIPDDRGQSRWLVQRGVNLQGFLYNFLKVNLKKKSHRPQNCEICNINFLLGHIILTDQSNQLQFISAFSLSAHITDI